MNSSSLDEQNKKIYFFELFSSIDFFSLTPSKYLTFDSKQIYSSLIGKFSSWLLIGIAVATFFNLSGDMLYHKNPQSLFSEIVTPDPPSLDLYKKGFFIAFGLQDLRNKSTHYIDDTIYTVQMIQRTKFEGNITLENIPLSRCSLDQVPDVDDLQDYYKRNQINNLFCMKNQSLIEPTLASTWDGPLYKNILIDIFPCINSSENSNKCKSQEIISAFINSGNFAMYINTLAINPSNFKKPITTFGKQIYTPISFGTLTYIEMLFGHLDFITDEGYLFEELNEIEAASYLSFRQILSLNSNMIVQIDMKLDKIKTTYIRKYDKIQNILANMGGLIKALMLVANFLILPLINLKFRLNLVNSIFHFKTPKKPSPDSPEFKKQKKMTKLSSKHLDDPQTLEKFLDPLDKQKIKISYSQYFCKCLRNKSSKIYNSLLEKGLKQIDQVLDISYIMHKLVEIDILKVLIFDEDQLNLVESVPKPIISLNQETTTFKNLHQKLSRNLNRKNSTKKKLALQAHEIISKKFEKSILDQKLLDLIPHSSIKKTITPKHKLDCKVMPAKQLSFKKSFIVLKKPDMLIS